MTTYGELVVAADLVAGNLLAAGLRPGEPVGVVFPRGPALISAMLGIGFAGGVYVPLSPDDPPTRIEALLDQVGVRLVLHDGDQGPVRRQHVGARSLAHDGPISSLPIYVMFTSGSTGTPKAVVVPNRAVVRLAADPAFCPLVAGDRLGFASNQMFDAATWEVWVPLISGATVVTIAPGQLMHAPSLAALLSERRVTHLMLTTSLFDRHCRHDPAMFGCLRVLAVGGEALNPFTIRAVLASASPPAAVLNVYGPTESTTFATFHHIIDVPSDAVRVPIGRAIAGTTLAVVDADGVRVAVGEPGELWLGGSGVALGYLDESPTASTKFVSKSDDNPGPGRWYRTGDLATIDSHGVVDCLGRIDQQLKIYGYRIEPAEVEAAIERQPGVLACAVLAEQYRASQRLIAFVVPAPLAHIDINQLRVAVSTALPKYMIPAQFVEVSDLPVTPNGKLDGAALLALDRPSARGRMVADDLADDNLAADGFDAIEAPECALVAAAWRNVLGHDAFGLDDDVNDVGGDSMALMEMVAWLSDVTGSDLAALQGSIGPVTIRVMAEHVRALPDRWAAMPPFVTFGAANGPPLALLPTAGGTILGSRWLAGALADTFTVAAASVTRSAHRGPRARSIGAAARHWVSAWRGTGLDWPAVVVGFSSGAIVAHEVSAQLALMGHAPALAVLVDPPTDVGSRSWQRAQAERVPRSGAAARTSLSAATRGLTNRPLALEQIVQRNVAAAFRQVHHHHPSNSLAATLLIGASDRDDHIDIDQLATWWRPLVRDLQVVEVQATHLGPNSVVGRRNAPAVAAAINVAFGRVAIEGLPREPRSGSS